MEDGYVILYIILIQYSKYYVLWIMLWYINQKVNKNVFWSRESSM